ncbi:hypothetical protein O181_058809 [Austropuccinia psidii MF-1]|uniref:Uncharacterized protein n=1 Tax=Austropuccinia psidii MF-1 TaxID=1389203 RepID=A0A9Q3ED80_9BASI|nr:hypothetical protein [Austropuccinia psidii MF-1]
MLEPFESHAHLWIKRIEQASEKDCMKIFEKTTSGLSSLERFFRTAAHAKPPIVIPSFAQESFQRACSENLLEDDYGETSFDLDSKLGPSIPLFSGNNKILPIPPPFINSDSQFERQDPQTLHSQFEPIPNAFITIGGSLFQLREVIDYWLPRKTIDELDNARLKWSPSLLLEQTRLRTIHELNSTQISFIENLQIMTHAIGDLREGAFGGRLNTKSIVCAKQMFETLGSLRSLVLRVQRSAEDRATSLNSTATWILEKFLPKLIQLKEPYQAERFDPTEPTQAHLGKLFMQHRSGMVATIRFTSQAFQHLSSIFVKISCMGKTMIESLHKLMLDVYCGQTTEEFIASWANRWEFASFSLLFKVLRLPTVNTAFQRNFPGMEVEFADQRGPTLSPCNFSLHD